MDGGVNNDEDEDGYILPMEDYNRLIHTEKFKRYFLKMESVPLLYICFVSFFYLLN